MAVKCLSKERMQNNTLEFMKEYEIMQSIEHANIVRLFGVVVSETSQILLITELAPLRSLLECLKELSLRSTFNVPVLSDFAKQVCVNKMSELIMISHKTCIVYFHTAATLQHVLFYHSH